MEKRIQDLQGNGRAGQRMKKNGIEKMGVDVFERAVLDVLRVSEKGVPVQGKPRALGTGEKCIGEVEKTIVVA